MSGTALGGLNYNELRRELKKLPITWYPDLISAMVEAAYEKNVFLEGGASKFVKNIENEIHKTGSKTD